MFKSFLNAALCFVLFASCTKSGYDESVVYNSNFNTGDQTGLNGAILYKYNGANIIGRYNNGGFTLNLANLPKHKAIQIEVVPYFHNSWDGNNNYGGIDGPDIWNINMDGTTVLNATFSNTPCNAIYCLYQSYPAEYGMINNPPKTGAYLDIAGICHMTDVFKTSVYKINKTIKHSASKVRINFRDLLVQKNVADQMCDESWSMGSLIIKVINTPE